MMQCCIEGCTHEGEPPPGYDFYLCDGCIEVLYELIEQEALLHSQRN